MAVAMSEEEIEREVRTLKNLRRRSTASSGPGELSVDPDLPPREAFEHQGGGGGPSYSSNDDVTLSLDGDAGLFWVPAHLHPELAPGEFRQFLKHHTQVDPSGVESGEAGEASLARSPSWLARSRSMSGSLNRKKSMLSKQYTPRVGDMVEEEGVPSIRRGSQGYGDTGMTLRDLQRLEEMVDDADGDGDDPEKMRQRLRRSMSGKRPGSVEEEGQGEAPLVAPRPGSIIRRTARTRIRKGDTKNRRFSSSARKTHDDSTGSLESEERRSDERRSDERRSDETSDERASFETAEATPTEDAPRIETSQADDDSNDESLIFDAYARDRSSTSTASSYADEDSRPASPPDERPALHPILTPHYADERWYDDDGEVTPTRESGDMSAALHAMTLLPESGPSDLFSGERVREPEDELKTPVAAAYEQPHEQQFELPPGMAPPLRASSVPSMSQNRTNGPVPPALAIERPPLSRTDSNTSSVSSSSSVAAPPAKAHKEKKSGLFGKKHHKDKDKDKEKHKKEKDGFLGSLFGSKKKTEDTSSSVANFATQGPAAAAALLGTSKSAKSLHAGSGTSSPTSPGFSNFARYPIHVERAVYRLSHIKLANARRPLIEQVLISNLMFWYLGVIGRAAGPAEDAKPGTVNGLEKDRDETARNPPSKGTPPKPSEGGALKRVKSVPSPAPAQVSPVHEHGSNGNGSSQSQRKTGLVKPERSRTANNSEAVLRAPQYGIQNAQVDKEMRHAPKAVEQQQHQPQQHNHVSPQQHHSPNHLTSPASGQYTQQQPASANPNRTSSIAPNRTRSPPATMAAPRSPEYPPGVAPPRPQSFAPGGRPLPPGSQEQPRQRVHSLPPGSQPMRPPGQPNMRAAQQQAYPQRNGEPGRGYPQHNGPSPPPHTNHGGPQPGQIFQYPGQPQRGTQPGQHFSSPQPGQIFHHPQFQQRPPPQPQWEQRHAPGQGPPPGQRPGQPGQPGQPVQGPPRRTSSNPQDYGRAQQTSPTHQSFYAAQRGQPQFQQYPNGHAGQAQPRPQPVPSGQYPHHR